MIARHAPSLPPSAARVIGTYRRWILALLVLGSAGTEVELLLLSHYEDPWQLTPLILIAAAVVIAIWVAIRPTAAGIRALKVLMWAFIAAGGLGVILHFRGGVEFALETDPTLSHGQLLWKVLRAKAPPALAPGVMAQMGLLGLIYTYTYPATRGTD